MDNSVHILHLEDDAADAELAQVMLESAGMACRIVRVRTREEFREALVGGGYDVILADYTLPGYDGVSALRLTRELCPDIPFVFVSGTMGEDAAIEVLTGGATDYVLKHRLSRLAPAVKRALREAESRREHKRAEERIERLNRLEESLLNPGSLQEKAIRIADGVVDIFQADFARIWLSRPGDLCDSGCIHAEVAEGPDACRHRDRCLHLVASSGRYTHVDGKMHRRVPFGCYKIGRIAAAEEPDFLTNDVAHDPRVHDHQWAIRLGLISFAGVRLRSKEGGVVGVLALFSKHAMSPDEAAFLGAVAGVASQVVMTEMAEEEREGAKAEVQAAQETLTVTQRRGERRLKKAIRELERRNRDLQDFVHAVSHDLRAPLVNIRGFADLLASACRRAQTALAGIQEEKALNAALRPLLQEEIPESLDYIATSSSRMDALLTGLLKVSRVGSAALTIEPLDLNHIVREIVKSREFSIERAGASVQVDVLPPCRGDAIQLGQVLSNLLDNALKYLDPARPGVVRVSGCRKRNEVIYLVQDNGIGIDAEHRDAIFGLFHRLDPERGNGLGLGLSIVRRSLERQHGKIWLESTPNQGSRFFFSLPAAQPRRSARSRAHQSSRTRGKS